MMALMFLVRNVDKQSGSGLVGAYRHTYERRGRGEGRGAREEEAVREGVAGGAVDVPR